MEWCEIEADGQRTVKFTELQYAITSSSGAPTSIDGSDTNVKKIGGILRKGELAWLARGNILQIISLRSGHTICTYEFSKLRGYENCCIKCVEELLSHNKYEPLLLAVVMESYRATGNSGSYISVFSLETISVLSSIELPLHITCARFVGSLACRRTLLQNFDGCLAVGSEEGVLVLLNMNSHKIMPVANELQDTFVPCQIVDYNLPLTEIHRYFRNCQKEGIHFGLQVEGFDSPCSIQCLLPIDVSMGLAVGLEDGRLVCYDLTELQIYYTVQPPSSVSNSTLVKMDYLEPLDDPRPCFYILALYDNGENLHALLHTLMFERRLMDEQELYYFEVFQNGAIRLKLPLEESNCIALTCQSIATVSTHTEDDSKSLFAVSWHSLIDEKNKVLLFDLNQWYKDEMPYTLEYNQQPNYLAGYILNGSCSGLQTLLNPDTISYFNSVQRFEEHFYPSALSFDCCLLHVNGSRRYNWDGVQNRMINILRSSNASIFLDPNVYFNEIIRTRLMPRFTEQNVNSTFSRNAKYEIILSVALEHNCFHLLRDCAKSWGDGSFMGSQTASTGLSLSTLTEWIWRRANDIKNRCNNMCKGILQYDGFPLDQRERKELSCITRELKLLATLIQEICQFSRQQMPEKVFSNLESKSKSLRMTFDYQNILLWLLNIGLLPEASSYNDRIEGVPYPYKQLKEFYKTKRSFFVKISESYLVKKTGGSRLLYIDALIEHECQSNALREYWLENQGDGLYPPSTIEAVLRVMLVPDMQYEHKCAILLYFFLDLNMAIEEEMYKGIVANCIKFPSVFKLPVDLAKTVQAFWNLDHGHLLAAVADFTSPISKSGRYPQWLVELLIEALLSHQAGNMALRILETQSYLISSSLKVRTLLASKLLSEAFHYVRSQNDDSLLQLFFNSCLNNGQFGVIRDFALTEREGLILQDILKKSKLCGAKSLHFVYLLQKSKYIEAVSYMDELAKNKISSSHVSHRGISGIMDTHNLVLSAFNTTMAPITKGLTDVYFKIKNKLTQEEFNNSSPVPFSCQLIKQNANNLLGGIYHSSALSAHFATYYWGEMDDHGQCEPAQVMNSNNAPFLRRPQVQSCAQDLRIQKNISYPQVYKPTDKRRYVEIDMHEDDMLLDPRISDLRGNPSKRRRQEVIGELNHIMRNQRKNRHTNVNTYNITEIDGEDTLCNDEINEAENFLKESLIKVTNTETTNVSKKQPLIEIQSILKSTNVTMVDGSVEEEKNLRFHLPDNDKEEDDDNTPLLTFLAEEEKQKENATTISIDSSRESVDDFYSNLSSQPNLNPLLSQSFKLDTSSSQTYMTGPLPRKPLARLSMEKPEKSIISESVNIGPNQTDLSDVTVPDELLKISPLVNEEMTSDCGVLGVLSTNVSSDNLFLHGRQNDSSLSAVIIEQIYKSNDIASQETVSKVATFSTHDLKSEKSEYSKSSFTNESSISLKNLTSQHFAPKISSSKLAQTVSDVCDANLMVTARNISSSSGFNSNNSKESTENPEVKMMETTLDMTNFEISTLEKSTTEPCQTLFLTAANTVKEEDAMKNKLSEGETITSSPHEEEMDFETSVCKTKEGEGESLSPLTTEFQNLQQTDNIQSPKDEAYIIVSLSSSSLSSYDNQDEKLSQSPDQTFCIDENECMDNLNTKDTKETTTNEELYDPYEYEEDIEDVEDNENIVFDYSEEEKLSINENDSDEFVDFVEDSSHSTSRNKSDENEDGVTDVFVVVDEQAVEKCDSSQQTCFDSFEDEDHKVQADASSLSIESQEAIVSCQPTLLGQKRTEDNQFSREPQSPKPVSLHEEEEKVSSQKPVISYFEDDNQKHLTLKTFMIPETMLPPEDSTSLASEIDMQINEHIDTSALQLDDVAHPLSNFEPVAEAIHMQILEHATTSTTTLKTVSDVEKFSETDEIVFSNASKIGHESKSIIEQNTKEITSLEYNQVKEPLTRNQGSCELINSKSDNEKPEKTCESIHVQLEKEEIIEIYSDDDTQLSEKAPELVKKKLSEVEQKSSLKIEELVDVENLDQQNLEGHKFIQNFDCRERNSSTVKKTDVAVQSYSVAAESTQTDPMVIPEIAVFSECEIAMEADAISFTDIDKEKDKVSVKTWIEAIERQLDASPTESRVNSERKSEEFVTNSPEVVASEIEGGENLISLKTEDFSDDVKPISIQNLQDPNLTQIEERQESLENMKTSVKSRRTLRGSSEPPKEKETNTSNIRIPHNRAKRGISLPPQTAGKTGHFTAAITSSTFSELNYCGESDNKEGSLNNPLAKTSDNKSNEATLNSPGQNSSPHYDSLQSMTATISKSRHSNLLEVISENPSPLDSPSSRTRSRLRGSSVNSDLDINLSGSNPSIVKRIRRISKSSSTSELPSARKRVRRASTGSETGSIDSTTPRRAKSVMSQQGEETESTSESPKVTDRTRSHLKRGKKGEEFKKNSSETPRSVKIRGGRAQSVMSLQEEEFESISESPKSTDLGKTSSEMVSLSESDLGYSSTRRLTRNQLAVLEKSAKLTELYKKSMKAEIERPYTPTQTASKQLRKTRSTRSNTSLQQESDDNESIISKRSTTSSTGRRVTRRSIKEKDETEDDQVSVISSVDSETSYIRSLRSRGKSLSSTALAAIPEVSSKANKEARKTSRSTQ